MNLLPPIPLYRRILRTHRYRLGPDERVLGDQYIKSEFRAHRNVENPVHIVCIFLRPLNVSIDPCIDWFSDRMANVRTIAGRR